MGRRVSRWAVTLAMAMFVAACTGAVALVAHRRRRPHRPRRPRHPPARGTCLSPARDDDPGDPADRPVRRCSRWSRSPATTVSSLRGPQIMIYPGPLLPNLQARPITDAGFAKIVRARSGPRHVHGERRLRAARRDARCLARAHRDRGRWRPPRPDRRPVAGHASASRRRATRRPARPRRSARSGRRSPT